jgi:ArsR family transcriptional regulator
MSQAPAAPFLSSGQLESVAALFKVLGEPMRLRILQTICHGPRHVGDIVASTGASQPNVSRHLGLLMHARVVERQRDGQRVVYALRDPLVTKLCELVCASLG